MHFKRCILASMFAITTTLSLGNGFLNSAMARTELDVVAQKFQPMPIAISEFTISNPEYAHIARDLRTIIANNLDGSGLFKVVSKNAYIEKLTIDTPPNPENWRPVGVAAIIVGHVGVGVNGQVEVSYRLWDAGGQGQLFSEKLSSDPAIKRRLAHKVSDSVYAKLTGEEPYFDTQIVFVDETGSKIDRRKRLAIMDQDGGNLRYLTSTNEYILTPRYAYNKHRIVFSTLNNASSAIHYMDPTTGRRERIISFKGKMVFAPSLSPNGDLIAYSIEDSGNTDLHVFNIATRKSKRVTSGFSIDTSPSWSPDGKKIVFNSDRGGSQQLYVMSATGGEAKRISYGAGQYATPIWSPKGNKIAFTKIKGGRFSIGIMSVDGSSEKILSSSFLDEAPSWSPNGRYLVFFRQQPGRKGRTMLYKVDISGYTPEVAIKTPQDASDPAWSPLLD
ncbi:MAG: TolB protein [Alphaproteobacteria bacterium]|jgi:TolB protein